MKYKKTILKGLKSDEIAKLAGVSKASVYNYCAGKARFTRLPIEKAIEELLIIKNQEEDAIIDGNN